MSRYEPPLLIYTPFSFGFYQGMVWWRRMKLFVHRKLKITTVVTMIHPRPLRRPVPSRDFWW